MLSSRRWEACGLGRSPPGAALHGNHSATSRSIGTAARSASESEHLAEAAPSGADLAPWSCPAAGAVTAVQEQVAVGLHGHDVGLAVAGEVARGEHLAEAGPWWRRRCGSAPSGSTLPLKSANVRGILRRSVPWSQVQAVLGHRQMGVERVALVLDSGERVVLRVPSTFWGSGAATAAKCRDDFHRLGQWWLAHRGPSWRPVRPEAPGAPTPSESRTVAGGAGSRPTAPMKTSDSDHSGTSQPGCARQGT